MTNLIRALAAEPFGMRIWEIAKLTPYQVRQCLMSPRDKDGTPILDPPIGEEPDVNIETEFGDHFRRNGVTDPDAVRALIRQSLLKLGEETAAMSQDDDED